jgi:hypothetical protein
MPGVGKWTITAVAAAGVVAAGVLAATGRVDLGDPTRSGDAAVAETLRHPQQNEAGSPSIAVATYRRDAPGASIVSVHTAQAVSRR